MNPLETVTLGPRPTLNEACDYYLRADILGEISRLTRLRDVELIYRTAEGRERHIALGPQTREELRSVFQQVFDPEARLAGDYYPWLHCWSNRAYEADPGTGQRQLIGFDSGRELDYSWRRSFAELYPGMAVLDELGIYYRVKFSGHRSLHLCIPAEAVPDRYRHAPEGDWRRWRHVVNTVGDFVHRSGCGDPLWSQMAGEEPLSGVYSLHRFNGLVGVPLLPSECRQFRPWMATVHLTAPVPNWWDVPVEAQDNFERALSRIRAGSIVFDLRAARSSGASAKAPPGYVAPALARARRAAAAYTPEPDVPQPERTAQQRVAASRAMVLGRQLSDEALRLALQAEDEDVRWFALEAQCGSQADEASDVHLPRTVQKLAAEGLRYEREAAADLLMSWGEKGFVLLLELAGRKRQWKKDGRGPTRRRRKFHEIWALQQYVEAGGEAAADLLAGVAARGDVEVCRAVCAILERCGKVGMSALMKLAASTNPEARREAVVALMYNGENALAVLEGIAKAADPEDGDLARRIMDASTRLRGGELLCWTMRPATLATLVLLGTETAVKLLGRDLQSGNRREAYHAARGLVYAGPASVPVLTDALQSQEPLVRRRASEALRDLAEPSSRVALQAALNDPDVGVRINAVRALARTGLPEDRVALASSATDPSRSVRRAVREALARNGERV